MPPPYQAELSNKKYCNNYVKVAQLLLGWALIFGIKKPLAIARGGIS